MQTRTIKPMPVVLVGEEYWRGAVDFDYLVDEGVIDREDRDLFWFAETAEEIWDGILSLARGQRRAAAAGRSDRRRRSPEDIA